MSDVMKKSSVWFHETIHMTKNVIEHIIYTISCLKQFQKTKNVISYIVKHSTLLKDLHYQKCCRCLQIRCLLLITIQPRSPYLSLALPWGRTDIPKLNV